MGKWGLGAPETESTPNKQGFDYFFGYNCQRQAHTLYPTHLWENEDRYKLNNKFIDIHQNLATELDPNASESYADFSLNDYAPELMHTKALDFLSKTKGQPFLLYYASPLPHVPLQAPQKWVKYYQNKLGKEAPYTKGGYYPNISPKATYAAMISYLDEQVGELVKKLKEIDEYDITLKIFTSDNGPSYAGVVLPEFFKSGGPFPEQYGRGKGFLYEGGIRVPMIAVWPDKILKNTESKHISSFYDVMASVGDMLQINIPVNDGISFLPALLDKKQKQHEYLYWEFPENEGQQALRMEKWKAVRTDLKKGIVKTQLYDLSVDIAEQNNVSQKNPKIIKKVEFLFKQNHTQSALLKFRMETLGDKIE